MASTAVSITDICLSAQGAARTLAMLGSDIKDRALEAIAVALLARTDEIVAANAVDLELGREAGLSGPLMDRLALDAVRV
ncbi:MAG TPA: gamma-glutamyl-phosphate reductase, partial [Solirubrobacteraceae bacterium]